LSVSSWSMTMTFRWLLPSTLWSSTIIPEVCTHFSRSQF
jgi:hypothetical protein